MFDSLAIVDVETTGMSPVRDRVIEIGILRIEKGKLAETFESLVNPEGYVPAEITLLTGISGKDLEDAPTFYSLRKRIKELLGSAFFVAHNARFDYSFLKSEYRRLEESYTARLLCTAKLSRTLFPRFRHHNLDSIIERFHILCDIRHRALSDAKVLWEFLQRIEQSIASEKLEKALTVVTKSTSLPPAISRNSVSSLPETPGVYIFYNQSGAPIYIGKSINLKDRIMSHFAEATTNTKEAKIFQSIASFEVIQTEGELGALLMESKLVKLHKPIYNRQLRDVERFTVLFRHQNAQGYYIVEVKEVNAIHPDEIGNIVAVFRSRGQMKTYLTQLTAEYSLCKKLLAIESGKGACFGLQLRICHGACVGREMPAIYNLRFIEAFRKTKLKQWPFDGPIAIREGNTAHVVSHWCYMGEADKLDDGSSLIFDYDTYKILSKYLLSRDHMPQIKLIDRTISNFGNNEVHMTALGYI